MVLPLSIVATIWAFWMVAQVTYYPDEIANPDYYLGFPLIGSAFAFIYWCWIRLREPRIREFRPGFSGWWILLVDVVCIMAIVAPAFAAASAASHRINSYCQREYFTGRALLINCTYKKFAYLEPINWWLFGMVVYHAILLIRLSRACDWRPLLLAMGATLMGGAGLPTLLVLIQYDNGAVWSLWIICILGAVAIFLPALRTNRANWRSDAALVLLFLAMWWVPWGIVLPFAERESKYFALFFAVSIFIVSLLPTQWLLNRYNALPR